MFKIVTKLRMRTTLRISKYKVTKVNITRVDEMKNEDI